jgi:hypothetical protein
MKSLQFDLPEYKRIEINGHVFDILMSDIDVLRKADCLKETYQNLKGEDGPEKIKDAILAIVYFIDEMLGAGAIKTIFKSRPVGLALALDVMTQICQAVVSEYQNDITEKYGGDDDSD